ncbi:hypothetical protein CDEST_15108 [Colletotrichum destructivum]|uniref:Uncharacterized protein n=1 Tax=Colletotrichum destructivum TaxID=34406 RepID=A0AAX4J3V8_9PEZI|nr:hypothetical protein CDEST_15108 [Colletotrichum destructivum]
MKNQNISLHRLQAAAVAFLSLRGAAAEKVFCVDANNKVVAIPSCDNAAPGTFFVFASDEEHPVRSTVNPKTVDLHDSAIFTDRIQARLHHEVGSRELKSGGFGKRVCDSNGGSAGGSTGGGHGGGYGS